MGRPKGKIWKPQKSAIITPTCGQDDLVLLQNFTTFYKILQFFLAQLAYELEVAKVQQKIRTEQIKIDVVVRKKQIEIEEEEMKRKEKELIGTVRLPAEAEAFK